MADSTKHTTDHEEIKHLVEEYDGRPAAVNSGGSRTLKILFPSYSLSDQAEEITWSEFFKDFDKEDLVFEYKEDIEEGEEVKTFRLIHE